MGKSGTQRSEEQAIYPSFQVCANAESTVQQYGQLGMSMTHNRPLQMPSDHNHSPMSSSLRRHACIEHG
jgi:hypothetical protein